MGADRTHEVSTRGQAAVLTGATGAIGFETAVGLARAGFTTGLVARDRRKGERAARRVRERIGARCPDVLVFEADLARQREVRRVAAEIAAALSAIDVLVHNAGIVAPERAITEDGVEMQLAVNALAPFLLTGLLLPQLHAAAPSRVLVVASRAANQGTFDFDDPDFANGYEPLAAYERSKLAATLFAYEAARRLSGRRIAVHALHPGVVDSALLDAFGAARRRRRTDPGAAARLRAALSPFRRSLRRVLTAGGPPPGTISAAEGARTTIWAATTRELDGFTGEWLEGGAVGTSSGATRDEELARRFWETAERMTGAATGTRCW